MKKYFPPEIKSIVDIVSGIPTETLKWITNQHSLYLDEYKFHQIDKLTKYLANCNEVKSEREDFVNFVEKWTQTENPDLTQYLKEYGKRFSRVRDKVEAQYDTLLYDENILVSKQPLKYLWRDFAFINEQDSLHGMFLTSGRWYVNVMLPVIKELIYCSLPDTVEDRQKTAYLVAKRVVTPQFAEIPDGYEFNYERKFANVFMPILQFYDRKLCFLFEEMGKIPFTGNSIEELVEDVSNNPLGYQYLLNQGIYPPFAWHEYHASKKPKKSPLSKEDSTRRFFSLVSDEYIDKAKFTLDILDVFKEYELNYNNYNYKGRFGLISKYFYYKMIRHMNDQEKDLFLDAIIGDRFFDALKIVEEL